MIKNENIAQIVEWYQTCHEDDRYVQDGLVAHGLDLIDTARQANIMWETLRKLAKSPVPGTRRAAEETIQRVLAVKTAKNRNLKDLDTQAGTVVGADR